MSKKRTVYSADFKAKIVLELLEGNKTLNELAGQYELLPKNIKNWKQQFVDNASLAFDKSSVVKEYKEEIIKLTHEKDATSKKLGEIIIERDFVVGKLKSLVSCNARVNSLDTRLEISLNKQQRLLSVSKTAYYYKPVEKFRSDNDRKMLNTIDLIHTKHPYYGSRRIVKILRRIGFIVGRNSNGVYGHQSIVS